MKPNHELEMIFFVHTDIVTSYEEEIIINSVDNFKFRFSSWPVQYYGLALQLDIMSMVIVQRTNIIFLFLFQQMISEKELQIVSLRISII